MLLGAKACRATGMTQEPSRILSMINRRET
jgi:hypothetical protein